MSNHIDGQFLQFYTEELDYLRRMSGEFAREFPAVAGRLDLTQFDCEDPWVERTLEGVAFLTARVRRELNGGLPLLAQSMVNIAEPRAAAPLPSFAILELETPSDLASVQRIPAGAEFQTDVPAGARVACRWNSMRETTIRPLAMNKVELINRGNPPGGIAIRPGEQAWLDLSLLARVSRQTVGEGGPLSIQLQGPPGLPGRLMQCLRSSCTRIAICDDSQVFQWLSPQDLLDEIDLEDANENAHQLLMMQRFSTLPQQFHGISLRGIDASRLPNGPGRVRILFMLKGNQEEIASRIETEMFLLHAVPVVNLFKRRADRIVVDTLSNEHEVVVDRSRPMDYEVFKIDEVEGISPEGNVSVHLRSVYDLRDLDSEDTGFYNLIRRPRPDSEQSRRNGRRSEYRGTNTLIALSLPARIRRESVSQISLSVWCTNRDLPLLLPAHAICRPRDTMPGVTSARIAIGPSKPRLPESDVSRQWNMLGHLGHGVLRSLDVANHDHAGNSIQSMLRNYIDPEDQAGLQQVDAIRSITGQSVIRRRLVGRRAAEVRGLACRIEITESALRGGVDIYTLPLVLSRFLRRLIPVGSFLETSVVDEKGEVLFTWMPTNGLDSML